MLRTAYSVEGQINILSSGHCIARRFSIAHWALAERKKPSGRNVSPLRNRAKKQKRYHILYVVAF
jgi:hypothetical protein